MNQQVEMERPIPVGPSPASITENVKNPQHQREDSIANAHCDLKVIDAKSIQAPSAYDQNFPV